MITSVSSTRVFASYVVQNPNDLSNYRFATSAIGPDISVNFSNPVIRNQTANAVMLPYSYRLISGSFGYYSGSSSLLGRITSFTISAVPEPESWALMLLALAMISALLRRKPARTTIA